MLNAKSPLPLYHQLAEILTARITSKEILPGQAIPSETDLCDRYGIGRPTVRQAVEVLVKKGLVERRRGSGTYVTPPKKEVDLFSLAGTSEAFLTRGIEIETRMLERVSLITVPDEADNPFSNRTAYFLSRLTLAEKKPVLLEDIYLDSDLFRGIDTIDLENGSLSRVVAEQFFLIPEDGRQTFRIVTLSSEMAGLLGISKTEAVLEVKRVLNFPKAEKAVYSRLLCRTQPYVFAQTLTGHARD